MIIGLLIYLGSKYQFRLEEEASRNFNLVPFIWYSTLFPLVIGLFLRLPKLVLEIKDNRPWTFDWLKFIAVAIPSVYILAMPIFMFYPSMTEFIYPMEIIMYGSPVLQIIAGVALGYILLDSLKK